MHRFVVHNVLIGCEDDVCFPTQRNPVPVVYFAINGCFEQKAKTMYRIAENMASIKFGESVPRTNWRVLNLAA